MPTAGLWPDGPQNGVYLTQSKDAAKAAIARFEEAYPDTIMCKRPVPASCVSGRGSVTAGMVRALPAQGHRSGGELISSMNSPSS